MNHVQLLHLGNTNSERAILPTRPSLTPQEYYAEMSRTKFILSPPGDRPDCFRHWEALGLGAIPISSINQSHYMPLFGRSMKFVPSIADMLPLLNDSSDMDLSYQEPNRHFVFSTYWASQVRQMKMRLMAANDQDQQG